MTKFGIKYFIERGYTPEEAKIENQKRRPTAKLYWTSRGYSEAEAKIKVAENNPTMLQYWLKLGFTEEEGKLELRKRHKRFKEYWTSRGYTEEEAIKQSTKVENERNKCCIEYWLKRGYSEEDGLKQIELKRKSCAENFKRIFTKSQNRFCKEFWIKKGYSEADAVELAKNANRKTTEKISHETHSKARRKYFQNMSDEEIHAKQIRDKIHSKRMKAKNKAHSPIFLEYWIAKGYSEEDAKIQVSNVKFLNQKNRSHSSKIEARCLDELNSLLPFDLEFNKWIRIGDRNFCVDAKFGNIVIEFNRYKFSYG